MKYLPAVSSSKNPVKFRIPTGDNLVPIRIDIESDGQRFRDAFTWNLSDPDSKMVVFAKRTVKDLKLPVIFVTLIAQTIQSQVADFRALEGQDMHIGEKIVPIKNSKQQASTNPDNYFNLRWLSCPAAEMVDGSKILYFEQAFWRTPQKPFRQRFFLVKPCPKEMKCDVELSTYAIRDAEEYKNFCDRPKDQRPQPEEVIGDIAEHLTTIHLKRCERGKRCLYEGSTPSDGFPNSWNGATFCTSEFSIMKNNEIHTWDRGYDDDGNQVWGVKDGPYEFKPAPVSSSVDMLSPLSFPLQTLEKRIEGSFVLQD